MNRPQKTMTQSRIHRIKKHIYILEYLLDHGESDYDHIRKYRPQGTNLRSALSQLYQTGLIGIHRYERNRFYDVVHAVRQTYFVPNPPRAIVAVAKLKRQMNNLQEMSHG